MGGRLFKKPPLENVFETNKKKERHFDKSMLTLRFR